MGTVEDLLAAKALCVDGETPDQHVVHAAQLEAAYAAFQTADFSNPQAPDSPPVVDAAPGDTVPLTADVAVQADTTPTPPPL